MPSAIVDTYRNPTLPSDVSSASGRRAGGADGRRCSSRVRRQPAAAAGGCVPGRTSLPRTAGEWRESGDGGGVCLGTRVFRLGLVIEAPG